MLSAQKMPPFVRRSMSPSDTVVSDESGASPRNVPVSATRSHPRSELAHVRRPSSPLKREYNNTIRSEGTPMEAAVRAMLSNSREDGGLGGSLRFSDVQNVVKCFGVHNLSRDTIDDIWMTLCELSGATEPPSQFVDCRLIADVLSAFGCRFSASQRSISSAGAKPIPVQQPMRCMSPTISSQLKVDARFARMRQSTPHEEHSAHPVTRSTTPKLFVRLHKEAESSRLRHLAQERERAEALEQERRLMCTFTPQRTHRSASAARTRPAIDEGHPWNGKVTQPTQSSLDRTKPASITLPSSGEGSSMLSSTEQWKETIPRRSSPSRAPEQVPVGYVEAVARLRQCALQHVQRPSSFEASLRNTENRLHALELERKITEGSILRLPAPSLSDVVEVKLAAKRTSPHRRR